MRTSFHEQLAESEGLVVETAGIVLQQIERTLRTLETRDPALADVVISGDDLVDERHLEIQATVLQLFATQAPVASDLRLLSAMLHINIHLERMADLCTNIAKIVKATAEGPYSEEIVRELVEMGGQAGRMLDCAIQAFAKRDLDVALSLPAMDESIDRLNRSLFKQVVHKFAGDEEEVEWGSRMVIAARQLERMGDHAVDIAEQVAFMITGEFREFTDASH
ncbi:MAG TPA: phosphate signaling complex protein PhoU [Actinomycetota bacterium]|jgi:phosphate transport system protein|nr:phosphate signaling complex protein PhoU [Actinomycetota bacterium]